MRRLSAVVFLAVAASACGPDSTAPAVTQLPAAHPADRFVPGQVIVQYRPGADAATRAARLGLRVARSLAVEGAVVLETPVGGELATVATLAEDPAVAYAEPNYLRQPTAINPYLWAFYDRGGLNMKYTSGGPIGTLIPAAYASVADADMDAIERIATTGASVVVGSLDTGVDLTHPEFTGRLIKGRDWVNNDADPSDDLGHGTHTAGTMAGSTVGVAGVTGAAARVKVHVQKVCGPAGCPVSAIVSAIRAAADYPGMVAMNLSFGGTVESQAERDAIAYATGKGVLVIASAGNAGTATVGCPACDPNAVSVAATTWRDERAPYSQYGAGLDLSAPGGLCYANTTPEGCIYSAYPGRAYAFGQGTSMAAPQVTGAAAVVASVRGLRGAALRAQLENTADDKGAPGTDPVFGRGRLNVYRAVTGGTLPAPQ